MVETHTKFQNKKSEAATQAAILANPLLLLATSSGLGPQQSVYDYFGVAVPWVVIGSMGLFHGIDRIKGTLGSMGYFTYLYCKWEIGL